MLRTRRYYAAAAAAVTASAVALAGAGATAAVAGPAAPRASLPTLTLTMNGKTITASGALQSGGVLVVSKVSHEPTAGPTLVRLNPGVSFPQFLAALPAIAADQNNIYGIGSLVFSAQAAKGTSSVQTRLAPGHYVALDVGGRGGKPPLSPFTITKASSPASLPKPQATIAAIEFGFTGPGRLHNGELVRFANNGFLVHMIIAVRARNARGAHQIARLLRAGKDSQAQSLATGFAGFYNALSHGAFQQQVVHAQPGYWVLACFMFTQDHREHTRLGMVRVIRIVK